LPASKGLKMNTSDLISTEMDTPRRVVLTFRTAAAAEQFIAASASDKKEQGAEVIYQAGNENGHVWRDVTKLDYERYADDKRIVYPAPPAQTTLTDEQICEIAATRSVAYRGPNDFQINFGFRGYEALCGFARALLTAAQSASGDTK
jgi:hypothetical protein